MLGRYGRRYAAFGGLAASILLLVSGPPSYGQQQSPAGGKERDAQQQQSRPPQGATAPVNAAVVQDKAQHKASEEPRDNPRDSWIIRSLKFFDRHNGAFNAFAAIAVAFFTWRLWRLSVKEVNALGQQSADVERSIAEAARAATAMEGVADAMKTSAATAQASVETIKERTAQQMRAYISVVVGEATYQEREKNLRFEGRPMMINTGFTPAHNVQFRIAAEVVPLPLREDFQFPLPSKRQGNGVVNSQQNLIMVGLVPNFIADQDVHPAMVGTDRAMLVWGDIRYDDVFGKEHTTRFAFFASWRPGGQNMGHFHEKHNDAD